MVVSPSDVFFFLLKRFIMVPKNNINTFLKKVRSAKRRKRRVIVSSINIPIFYKLQYCRNKNSA